MCFMCELRRRADEGDFEAQQQLTQQSINDPQVSAGMALLIGAMMVRYGVTSFEIDPSTMDLTHMQGLQFERNGDMFKASLLNAPIVLEARQIN
jgi:hypothetical protein